ncbi:MAG: ferritin-like domain-containing protein [Chitinophagaceae bacterium]|nr:ferritin-like domain-containing protein [Chitinophagaceae bacterium]
MNYKDWNEYFLSNQGHFRDIDFDAEDKLTHRERSTIKESLQQFQRGENSEGKHLFSYARMNQDPDYLPCISLFIREEQSHARVLGSFMAKHCIRRISGHWVDGVFRWLRQLAGLENTIRVLLTAEIIAKVYYDALHDATRSILLRKICNQILKDEDKHIEFQCYTLSLFKRKSFLGDWLKRCWNFTLMFGTILIVWLHHRKVYTKGGYGFRRVVVTTMNVYFEVERSIRKQPSFIRKKEMSTA